MWEAILLSTQLLVLGVVGWGAYEYIRLRERIRYCVQTLRAKMDCDELIDQLLESEEAPAVGTATTGTASVASQQTTAVKKRERLAALAAGGQAKQYLGRAMTADQVDEMMDDEVEKLYARYEAKLGAAMTNTLGSAALQLYAAAVSTFLPIPTENRSKLVADLEEDPFVGHALSTATCELYHRYGIFLAPITAALTTAKHCQFKATCLPYTEVYEDVDDGGPSSGSSAAARDSRDSGCSREGDFTSSKGTTSASIRPGERP